VTLPSSWRAHEVSSNPDSKEEGAVTRRDLDHRETSPESAQAVTSAADPAQWAAVICHPPRPVETAPQDRDPSREVRADRDPKDNRDSKVDSRDKSSQPPPETPSLSVSLNLRTRIEELADFFTISDKIEAELLKVLKELEA
jgi:hypothetical protein